MRKLKLIFACLLMAVLSIGQVWADPAAVGTTLFSEDFSGYAKDAVPGGSVTTATGRVVYGNANVSYACTNGNGTKPGTTKIYTENLATGTSPEILVGKYGSGGSTGGTFSVTGIPSGGAQEITVSYKQNKQKLKVAVSGLGYTSDGIDAKPDNAGTVTFDITVADGAAATFNLTFSVYSSNVRVDDILVTVKTAGEGGSSTPTCANPTFSPAAGAVLSGTEVSISCATEGATVHYTLDGSDPTETSATAQPISITSAKTIKAIAVKSGYNNSNVASASYTIVNPLATMQDIFDASATAGIYYITFSNNWVVTGVSSDGKNAYITDGTKGLILYNSGGNMDLVAGSTLSGTKQCSLTRYGGVAEISNFSIEGLTKSTGTLPAVQELDAEGVAALSPINTGALIKVNGAYTSSGYISDVKLYNVLSALPSMTVGATYNCTGVYIYYKKNNTTAAVNEIAPRTADDIEVDQTANLTEVTGLAALKAEEVNKSYYVNLTNAVVTYVNGKNAFIEDATAGALIYFDGHGYNAGDCLNGKYQVTVIDYNGKFEITAMEAQAGAATTTADIPLTTLTIAQLNADFAAYESRRVKIEDVTVSDGMGGSDRKGEISKEMNTLILYAASTGLSVEENSNVNVIGYPTPYVTSNTNEQQFFVWEQADIKVNVKEDPELAWNPADNIEMTVGEEFTAPTLTNPHNVTVTIESDNTELATVTAGVVSLVENATGTATITASFEGDATYNATQVSYTITVNAAAPVLTDYYEKVTETTGITDGTYLIIYEGDNTHTPVALDGSLETLEAIGNNIAVTIVGGNKIAVSNATEASTFYIDVTAGTIQSASGKYIGANSYGNRLDQSDEASTYANTLSIDADGNAVITLSNSSWSGDLTLRYNYSTNNGERFRYYKSGQQPIALYKLANEVVKANPELAWSTDAVELTVGDEFTAPTLTNPNSVEGVTYASDNENLATVTNAGVIELVANATGTAQITASFAGDDTYKAVNISCTITVNAVPTPPTPAGEENVVILAVYKEKYYAMSTTTANSGFKAVAVEYDGAQVTVNSAEDKAAIQWTKKTSGENTTFQNAEAKYMKSADGASMSLQDAVCNWVWDESGYYKISGTSRTFFFQNTSGGIFKNYATSNLGGNGYSDKVQIIVIDPENIVITSKAEPNLAYDPASVTLTVGQTFVPATLTYAEGFDGLAAVTYASNNENVATVEGGVVSLVADATGTATITATFAGNNNYLAGSASYLITVNEAGDDLSGTWNRVTAVAAGQKIIIAGTYNSKTMAMGKQNSNNRAAVLSAIDGDELTPGAATKVFTLVDAGEGLFAIQASNGKYLNAAGTGSSNYLREADDFEAASAKWTITFDENGANIVATSTDNRNVIRYNSTNNSELFSCYAAGGQRAINIYSTTVAPDPEPQYETVRGSLTAGNYYTVCYDKTMTAIQGASLWSFSGKDAAMAYIVEAEAPYAAGTPYLIYAESDKLEALVEEVPSPVADSNNGLYGTFSYMSNAVLAGNGATHMLKGNAIRPIGDGYLEANRAYIKLDEIGATAPAPGRRVRAIPLQKNTPTDIDALNASDAPVKMLIDGQIYILRGEKIYNVNGQVVK